MEKSKESVANTLKKVTSISQVADRFSISRPTLYKYMDYFDNGEYDRIPENILSYFSAMANAGGSPDESAVYLLAEERRKEELIRASERSDVENGMGYRARAVIEGAAFAKGKSILSWSEGPCSSICYPTDGGAVVFMKDIPEDAEASVVVSIVVGGEATPIGRFHPAEGMAFADISGLPSGPEYEYTVEHARNGGVVRSEARKLVLGCRE